MHATVIAFNATQRPTTEKFRAGDVVRVHRRIVEGSKERIQIFEGMIIAIRGGQSSSPMITVRKASGGVGVEIIVPVAAPMIHKIEIIKRAGVRRAKLGFVRSKPAKKLRFKYTTVDASAADTAVEVGGADTGDDLTKVEGISPKIATVLAAQGITTFAALADATEDTLRAILEQAKLTQYDPATWPRQAALARDGKWDELDAARKESAASRESA